MYFVCFVVVVVVVVLGKKTGGWGVEEDGVWEEDFDGKDFVVGWGGGAVSEERQRVFFWVLSRMKLS